MSASIGGEGGDRMAGMPPEVAWHRAAGNESIGDHRTMRRACVPGMVRARAMGCEASEFFVLPSFVVVIAVPRTKPVSRQGDRRLNAQRTTPEIPTSEAVDNASPREHTSSTSP
jgi:hypothetical protein